MKTLTKLDGTVVNMPRGRPARNLEKQIDGNYKEIVVVAPEVKTEETVTAETETAEA